MKAEDWEFEGVSTESAPGTFRELGVVSESPVRRRHLDELKPLEGNPRSKRDEAFAALVESLKDFGVEQEATCAWQPIVVNVHPDFRDRIIGGHQRWEATRAAGFEHIWTREVSLDSDQMRELAVRLNVAAGEWDWSLLAEQFSGQQLLIFGFNDLEFPQRLADDDVELEIGGTVGEEAAKRGGSTTRNAIPVASTRQYQLFLVGEEYQELLGMIRKLREFFQTDNTTQAVMKALRDYCDTVLPEENADEASIP